LALRCEQHTRPTKIIERVWVVALGGNRVEVHALFNFCHYQTNFMPHSSVVALALLASTTVLGASAPASTLDGTQLAQVTIRERIIIRVPSMAPRAAPLISAVPPPRYVEKKGPKCIAAADLGGAIVGAKSVDLVLRGGERVRAMLDGDCPALDFYSGFYLKPSADGQICSGRDTIRSRSGDSCEISTFRKLVIKR
jgi:hypothetical protein